MNKPRDLKRLIHFCLTSIGPKTNFSPQMWTKKVWHKILLNCTFIITNNDFLSFHLKILNIFLFRKHSITSISKSVLETIGFYSNENSRINWIHSLFQDFLFVLFLIRGLRITWRKYKASAKDQRWSEMLSWRQPGVINRYGSYVSKGYVDNICFNDLRL